jgi:tRNA A-37 threonylcarbamoyl transferase component Bud32
MRQVYTKSFANVPEERVAREVSFQREAAELGFAPKVIATDNKTFIKMQHLNEMCLADMYGDDVDDIPISVQEQIIDIVWLLYDLCYIEYLDVTPYNFIEKDGLVMIIDFGDARKRDDSNPNPFLQELFDTWKLKWNPDFR